MQVMLHEQAVRGMGFDPEVVGGNAAGPLAPKETHFPAKAKRVIFLFMSGGPSQVDLFDPKPELARLHGKELPYRLPDTEATVGLDQTRLLGPVSGIKQHGESGMAISEWLPHTAKHIDSLCVLRAMQADSPNHPTAIRQLHTGNLFDVVPSMGLLTLTIAQECAIARPILCDVGLHIESGGRAITFEYWKTLAYDPQEKRIIEYQAVTKMGSPEIVYKKYPRKIFELEKKP
jgi:hypothetical protein